MFGVLSDLGMIMSRETKLSFSYECFPLPITEVEYQGIALNQRNVAWRNGTKFEVRRKRDGSGK